MEIISELTHSVVGLVTAITTSVTGLAVGISGDDSGESQNNQSDLSYTIIYLN